MDSQNPFWQHLCGHFAFYMAKMTICLIDGVLERYTKKSG